MPSYVDLLQTIGMRHIPMGYIFNVPNSGAHMILIGGYDSRPSPQTVTIYDPGSAIFAAEKYEMSYDGLVSKYGDFAWEIDMLSPDTI